MRAGLNELKLMARHFENYNRVFIEVVDNLKTRAANVANQDRVTVRIMQYMIY